MAADPTYPLTGNRVMADEQDRGGGPALVQRLRIVDGIDPTLAATVADLLDYGLLLSGGSPRTVAFATSAGIGGSFDQPTIDTGSAYADGDTLGGLLTPNLYGAAFTDTVFMAQEAQVIVVDAESLLDDGTEVWLALDTGTPPGFSADNAPFDLPILEAANAWRFRVTESDAVVDFASGRRIALNCEQPAILFGAPTRAAVKIGGGGTWVSADSVGLSYSGRVLGFGANPF